MSVEEIKSRFLNEIELRAYDDMYVDKNEEREILQLAIQLGINIDAARADLANVCADHQYVLESAVLKAIREQVEAAAADDGKVDQGEFEMIVTSAKRMMMGKKNERQIKLMIIQMMEDTGNTKVKTGWFSDWYAAMKKDLGLA